MLLKVFSNDQLLAIAFSLAKDTVSAGARSMESQPCFGFAKRSNFCELASFNFNLLYTVGRRDRITLPGRLPGFFGIHLLQAAACLRKTCYSSCYSRVKKVLMLCKFGAATSTLFFSCEMKFSMELVRNCCKPKPHPLLCSVFQISFNQSLVSE